LVSPHCGVIRALDRVPADVTEPAVPIVMRAEVANNRFRSPDLHPFQPCSGKGMDAERALMSTIGEACERYGSTAWTPDMIRRCRIADLGMDHVSPADLVLFADDQYDALRYARWDPTAEIGWFTGFDAATREPVAVPAVEAVLGYEGSDADHLYLSTSNGLAAGASPDHAALNATLEVIERDAYLISWCNRLPGTRINPITVPNPIVHALVEAYRRRSISLELYRVPTDVDAVSVYVAIGVQLRDDAVGPGPAAVVGLGADTDDAAAAGKAALEVGQIRPALKGRLRDPEVRKRQLELIDDPARVDELDDHDLLFAHPDALPWLAFWREHPAVPWSPPPRRPGDDLSARLASVVGAIRGAGSRLVVCELTPPELAALDIHVARAVVPGFQPIHFGADELRLGGTRLYDVPSRLGLSGAVTRDELNLLPHPIS
jgi:ribosomal protein S12 methylthiotransferase accessory factor